MQTRFDDLPIDIMIETKQLTKHYGPVVAVNGLDLSIPDGQIVGFLGPNGAGKTTTLRMLTGYIPPTSGQACVAGFDVLKQSEQARRQIGYLPENNPVYPEMRVDEYLEHRGKLLCMSRTARKQRKDIVTDRCGLSKIRRRVIGQLSKGNRQRVGLAAALLHEPQVLILDEPTAGLDPNQISEVRRLIGELREKHTVLVSSHILPEIEKMADRVVIIAGGHIAADDTPTNLRKRLSEHGRLIVDVRANGEALQKAMLATVGVKHVEIHTQGEWSQATITPDKQTDSPGMHDPREALGQMLLKNNWAVREMRYDTPSLEQFFIEITAKQDQAA